MGHRKRITVVGAGNVGAATAQGLLTKQLADIVLLDVAEGLARGKALDLMQTSPIEGFSSSVIGTSDYAETRDSNVVIITAGIARKSGMSREDLVSTNAAIVREVVRQAVRRSPNAYFVVVSNPLDVMCYIALKESGVSPHRVFGQSGVLDSARFRYFLATEIGIAAEDVTAMVLGGHGDEMVPLVRYSYAGGIPIERLLSAAKIAEIVTRTRQGGAEIVSLLETGSAYYAPAAATVRMVQSILLDKKLILPTSVYLQGEYGIQDLYFGVPAVIGSRGIERIIELDLTTSEREGMAKSAGLVRSSLKAIS